MIGKQIKGRGFYGCLKYVLSKPDAEVLGGTVSGTTIRSLARQFRFYANGNPQVQRVVYHAILSTAVTEPLDNDTWTAIAQDYLEQMGYTQVPYLIVRHRDTEHHHVHIVASRVKVDGSCVSDSWDYLRSTKVIRQLEEKYGLSTPRLRRMSHQEQWKFLPYQPLEEERNAFTFLQNTIERCCQTNSSLVELVRSLSQYHINVILHKTQQTNKIRGLAYEYKGQLFTGTQLGVLYTWNGLIQKRGLSFAKTDETLLHQLTQQKTNALPKIIPQEQNALNVIAPIAKKLLDCFGDGQHLDGKLYSIQCRKNQYCLIRKEDRSIVYQAISQKGQNWKPLIQSNITEKDLKNFELIRQQLETIEIRKNHDSSRNFKTIRL
ncbi:mobilization protein [Aphanothece hegewaldii CCALA 016]|uniref:Mobilization protein n=1 Tax=Aphanothece hegewaldii CCALA 016 TaxID=2107694 RepID=A0A2T1LT25_9CHRO|nr:relaxase/mobilization nuclease domain-containing protein [Aphanothece hegewaldii]PSF33452.1 mobilization protein [Aphanothece hegewaldii CCALA 016]